MRTSIRLIYLTTTLLTISQIALAAIFITVNIKFQIVINSAARWMSVGDLIAASWTDRWGSYHLWTWFTWVAVSSIFLKLHSTKFSKDEVKNEVSFFFELLLWGAIVVLFLLIGQRPFRVAETGSVASGLSPALLSIWNYLHPPLAFASYAGFFISWAISSYFWIKSPYYKTNLSQDLINLDRLVTRITWVLTSLVLTLGILWSHEANWGGYWSWDEVIVISIILWLTGGYRLHLHEIGRNQPLYNLLGMIGLPLVFFAAWIITSNILEGLHSYAGSPIAPLFLVLIFISSVPIVIGWKLHKWKLLSPVKVSDDVAKPSGFNIGVLAFNFLLLGNFLIILLQIFNAIFELDRDFGNTFPLLNAIGFFGIVLGLTVDTIQHKYNSRKLVTAITLVSIFLSYIFWIQHIDATKGDLAHIITTIFEIIFITTIIFTIILIISSDVNKFRFGLKITPRRLVSHVAMLMAFLIIIANGPGPALETRASSDPYILEIGNSVTSQDGLIVLLDKIEGPFNNSRGILVMVYLSITKDDNNYKRTIDVIDQHGLEFSYVQSTWITFANGKEIFFNLQRGDPLRIRTNSIVGIHLIIEEYFITPALWIASILFAAVPILPSKLMKRN